MSEAVRLSHHEDCRHVVAELVSRTYDHDVGGPVQVIDPAPRWECVETCQVRIAEARLRHDNPLFNEAKVPA